MSVDIASERSKVHRLVDVMPAAQLGAVRALFESMMHPVDLALAYAEADEEPLTDEEMEAIRERGAEAGISLDDYLVDRPDKQVA